LSRVYVAGIGAVSPAGWGVPALSDALMKAALLPNQSLQRPGWKRALRVRQVPPPTARPAFLAHPRLRRSSPVSQYAVAAALEALGRDAAPTRLGIVQCVMSGCVNYSRRYYDEVLRDPGTASPLLFPETVFNAPSSHLAALLGSGAINYTLVGDPGTFLQGLALGAHWLSDAIVDDCLVVGTEEMDWLTADAFRMFSRRVVVSEGAGALYLSTTPRGDQTVELVAVTDSCLFSDRGTRTQAAALVTRQLPVNEASTLLCDSLLGISSLDEAEAEAWRSWKGPRHSPKQILGEGLMAASAWQCVAAVDALQRKECDAALVSVMGCNQQAIGARFARAGAATAPPKLGYFP